MTNAAERRLHQELYERNKNFRSSLAELGSKASIVQAAEILRRFDLLSSTAYRVRARFPNTNALRNAAEEFVLEASQDILNIQKSHIDDEARHPSFYTLYREAWQRHIHLFLFVVIFFATVLLSCMFFFQAHPSYASVVLPQHLMEQVLDQEKWFETLQASPLTGAFKIGVNNSKVGLGAFFGGALAGLGTLYLTLFNAIQIGALKGYSRAFHFGALFDFVGGHGPLELTLICCCAFAGFIYAKTFYSFGTGIRFADRFRVAAKDATLIIIGVIPWFFVAATLEAFLSPFHYLKPDQKLLVGLGALSLFLLWTFWPILKKR